MEHYDIEDLLSKCNIRLSGEQIDLMHRYVDLLYESSKTLNLTGFLSRYEILRNLIIDSIAPLAACGVPRGTSYADIGTGQGIPGIPIAVVHPESRGLLIDSNRRKIEFVKYAVESLSLKNIEIRCIRVEDCVRMPEFREQYDNCLSRAFGSLYMVLELSSSIVRPGGIVFIYSNIANNAVGNNILAHGSRVGLSIAPEEGTVDKMIGGLLFNKISPIDPIYPRRIAIIKRESKRSL